jgi:hypothetical protein
MRLALVRLSERTLVSLLQCTLLDHAISSDQIIDAAQWQKSISSEEAHTLITHDHTVMASRSIVYSTNLYPIALISKIEQEIIITARHHDQRHDHSETCAQLHSSYLYRANHVVMLPEVVNRVTATLNL